jgi:hypothetical protein
MLRPPNKFGIDGYAKISREEQPRVGFMTQASQIREYQGSAKWSGSSLSRSFKERCRPVDIIAFDHPEYDADHNLTVHRLEDLIRSKILSASQKNTSMRMDTWKAFCRCGGSERTGLTVEQIKTRCQQWGIRPTDNLLAIAFKKWDADGGGDIDFDEFCDVILPKDYSDGQGMMEKIARGFTESPLAGGGLPKREEQTALLAKLDRGSVEKTRTSGMSKHDVVAIIREKILQGSKGGNSEMGDAYARFGRPKYGISKKAFKHKLNTWGLFPSTQQLDEIFGLYVHFSASFCPYLTCALIPTASTLTETERSAFLSSLRSWDKGRMMPLRIRSTQIWKAANSISSSLVRSQASSRT